MSVDVRDILQSIDRDLDYYRTKLQWLYKYSLVSVPIVLAVYIEKSPIVNNTCLEALLFSSFFVGVLVICMLLRKSLVSRIYELFSKRNELLSAYSETFAVKGGFFTNPQESKDLKTGKKTINPSKIYIFAIALVCMGAVAMVWLRILLSTG